MSALFGQVIHGETKAQIVREPDRTFEECSLVPTLSITHVYGKWGTGFFEPVLNTLTMLPITDTPHDLAKAFLTFVSQKAVPYTDEELEKVSRVILDIHERAREKDKERKRASAEMCQ